MTKDSGERQTSYVASAFQAEKISLPEEVGGKVEELAESNYVQEWEPAVVVAEGIEEPIPVEVPETRIPKYIKGIQVQYPNPESLNIQAQEEHEIMASSSKYHLLKHVLT
jgi:hypothetical protein